MAGTSLAYLGHAKIGSGILFDDDIDSTVFRNADSGPTTLWLAQIQSANAAATYLSIWNKRTATGGSDPQDYQFPIPANGTKTIFFERGAVLSAGLSYMMTTGKGTGASGNPATPPDGWFVTSGGVLLSGPTPLTTTIADPTPAGPFTSSTITAALSGPPLTDNAIDSTTRLGSASAITIYATQIDNSASNSAAYFKAWNVASTGSVTLGTTDPDIIIYAPAGLVTRILVPQGLALGTGLVYACVTAGGTGGTVAPTTKPALEMLVA